ncbi:hypothetical protein L5515_003775 [Caenorhabditis briggsae]|uniref:Phospholipid-transporting ATPase n=1 Tax=Caenorhabditis briggsae TaxID=6238 RepID=A0AAE9EIQ9_CAEBR|nr:hypothetical protein L5515_003775 [Caenorhabditis briggsae]
MSKKSVGSDVEASTSNSSSALYDTTTTSKGHHRRTSSLWVPPTRPIFSSPTQVIKEKAENGGRILKSHPVTRWLFPSQPILPQQRIVVPNNQKEPPPRYEQPNRRYCGNRISTTKYSVLTFIPKNLFEQLHRAANLYFIFIVILNMIIGAFGKYISVMPIAFVLGITAIKDAFEDYRRYKSDQKINHSTCRVWDASQQRYRKLEWQNILVGDFVHLSHDEIIPADILLLRSSDVNGVCYVETCNLDGESNLKQRQAIRAMGKYHNSNVPLEYSPSEFNYRIACEGPTTDVYKFEGRLEAMEGGPPLAREFTILAKENVLLRGCVVKNTDFVEGIVLYAGKDTKAMLNNSGPRYKRSSLEKMTNIDILWSVCTLLALCVLGAVLSGVWLRNYSTPYTVPFLVFIHPNSSYHNNNDSQYKYSPSYESWFSFWSYIIVLQVMIPISLYVSIEFIKIFQVWFMSQDRNMYYDKVDKRLQCRALNITEELGQIQYVMSDKTGTLTENQMVFRRCSVNGSDFGGRPVLDAVDSSLELVASNLRSNQPTEKKLQLAALAEAAANTGRLRPSRDPALESKLASSVLKQGADIDDPVFAFFLTLAICNTVVVNAKPHEDLMDPDGDIVNSRFATEEDALSPKRESSTDSITGNKMLADVEEESLSSNSSTPVIAEEKTAAEDGFEEIELIEFPEVGKTEDTQPSDKEINVIEKKDEEKEGSNNYNGERKEGKGFGILHRPSILSVPFAKLKGIKSPFRRSVDKRSSSSDVNAPPPHSFYDSESPDELALVEAAREYGVRLLKRRFDDVVVYLRHSTRSVKYKVLHTLPFDADRKRMSVIIRENTGSKRIIVLTKGADATVLPVLSNEFCTSTRGEEVIFKAQEHLTMYAKEGLRTLCLSMRVWTEEEYLEWKEKHEEAELDVVDKETLVAESILRAEQDLELLGVTAIEDRLQDGVPECIHSLREAGIRVWVLTGDKIETAVNIAYSSRLFSPSMDLLNIGANGVRAVSDLLGEHLKRIARAQEVSIDATDSFGLVLNAATMSYCLDPHNVDRFVKLLRGCRSVLCCRATPLQKAQLVNLAKNHLKGKVLAIGDGANDVSMIQGADVGVGLSGQEGMQAVMSSDFAMARFRFLSNLLLVHGHWNYYRLAQTILYFFYKNAMLVFVIFWYQIFNGFSAQVPIDPVYLMVYNLIFTSVPPLLFGCLDQDASAELLLDCPKLYGQGRLGKRYRWYSFWINMLDAIWQSLVVYFICHFTYRGSNVDMWTFGHLLVTQLIIVNTFHLALFVQYWTWPMFWSMFLSVLLFFICALLYNGFVTANWTWTNVKDPPSMVSLKAFSSLEFWMALCVSVILCLVPRYVITAIVNTVSPSTTLRTRLGAEDGIKKSESRFASCAVGCLSAPFKCTRLCCKKKPTAHLEEVH